MLTIHDLKVQVDGKTILNGLNLEVRPGEVHAIMGPNGSGKSTLANVIAGRDGYEVTSGVVTYQGNRTDEANKTSGIDAPDGEFPIDP